MRSTNCTAGKGALRVGTQAITRNCYNTKFKVKLNRPQYSIDTTLWGINRLVSHN